MDRDSRSHDPNVAMTALEPTPLPGPLPPRVRPPSRPPPIPQARPTTATVAHPPGTAYRFVDVYDQHFAFVWRSVRRLGVPDRSLDDAAQDVFIVVHRKLAEFEGRSTLKSWLFGIARRVAKDHRRRVKRKERGEVLPEGLADPSPNNPRDAASRSEAAQVLHALLDSLDADKREVFILAELEQMTAPEIAQAISVNLNTVYSRLRAARQGFEQAVARYRARDANSERTADRSTP